MLMLSPVTVPAGMRATSASSVILQGEVEKNGASAVPERLSGSVFAWPDTVVKIEPSAAKNIVESGAPTFWLKVRLAELLMEVTGPAKPDASADVDGLRRAVGVDDAGHRKLELVGRRGRGVLALRQRDLHKHPAHFGVDDQKVAGAERLIASEVAVIADKYQRAADGDCELKRGAGGLVGEQSAQPNGGEGCIPNGPYNVIAPFAAERIRRYASTPPPPSGRTRTLRRTGIDLHHPNWYNLRRKFKKLGEYWGIDRTGRGVIIYRPRADRAQLDNRNLAADVSIPADAKQGQRGNWRD